MRFISVLQTKSFAILCAFAFFATITFSQAPTPTPGVREEVVVTANRTQTRLEETPASIVTLSNVEVKSNASPVIDDILRQTVGFNLFRRSNSRNANPTTQGASFRGTGSSGASRSLVLLESVPLNDPFGGWILWNRVPTIAIERVEVLRGGASSLYGSSALSGTINIIPRQTKENFTFSAEIFGGMQKTLSASTFFGFKQRDWTLDFIASNFQTKGYIAVDETQRELVDQFSGSKNSNFSGRIARNFKTLGEIFVKPAYFGEVRSNGTGLQTNRTHLRQIVVGGNRNFVWRESKLNWLFYGGTQVYDQIFSTIASNRNSESLNRIQRVPSQNFGFSSQFSTTLKNQTFLAGFETKQVRGASNEIAVANNRATSLIGSGGREKTYAFYFQDFAKIGKVVLVGNLRFDSWQNHRALSATKTLSTNLTATTVFPKRAQNAFSPQLSVLYQLPSNFALFASLSQSFRAPSLNELYRAFRVGNVLTLANENLKAEKATNFESGLSFSQQKVYLRGNFFWTDVSNPVSNVTLAQTPTLITRQRQNVGKTRSRGMEIESETHWKGLNFSIGYLFADSIIAEFPANKSLEKLRIPQTSRHQITFQTRYARKDWSFAFQGRAASKQFDDDLNTFELEPYFQLDAFAAKKMKENLQVFIGLENIFNSRYSVGKTPIRTVSSPFNLRVGFRWK
ncbi:MAG TPA: TonB-dependent receptor [Pyrinomonadaceae bacterium]|nr:TonB-dependent receptor [Pyrinomonadaceae bacterium]